MIKHFIILTALCAACTQPCPQDEPVEYLLGVDILTYREAEAFCDAMGGSLAVLDSAQDWQTVLDTWTEQEITESEVIWIGNVVIIVDGNTYGYGMLRSGSIATIARDEIEHKALPMCEFRK